MRAYLPAFEFRQARSVEDAVRLMASPGAPWRPFAGGTDLMVLLSAGTLKPGKYVSLWGLDAIRGVDVADGHVTIGALTTYREIRANATLRSEFPMLGEAAAETGGIANQNRGTIGGNIANASPAADTPPALLAYDAELVLISPRGERRVPYARFHTGYKQMDLAPDEIIASITIPRRAPGWRDGYRKVGGRLAQAISKVCFAGSVRLEAGVLTGVRLAFGSVAPTVRRAMAAERVLEGAPLDDDTTASAIDAVTTEISPIDDVRSTARYRRQVAANLLHAFLDGLRDKMP
jgi:CO/xanthine dehydrogenase FAD-binding subunit